MASDENSENVESSAVWLRRFSANDRGRDFVVGDIHGCLDEFISLLAHARFNPKRDRVFSVGDIIDRGPKSAECLDLLEKPWFNAVRGNHEQMLLDHWANPNSHPSYDSSWLSDIHGDSVPYYRSVLARMPHVIKVGAAPNAFYLIHAEIWDAHHLITDEMIDTFAFSDTRQTLAKILWSRHIVAQHMRTGNPKFHSPQLSRIFCGHTIVQTPTTIEQSIYLDTGAFAPYVDPKNAQAEHYGLSLVEASTLHHWFAPTCLHYRGTVVDMGHIDASATSTNLTLNDMQPESPS